MRIRTIKPEFFENIVLQAMPDYIDRLFIGLWCNADRRGRLVDRPYQIWKNLSGFKHSVDVYEEGLKLLMDAGMIIRYRARIDDSEVPVILVTTFEDHQRINGKEAEKESEIPAPPGDLIKEARKKQRKAEQLASELLFGRPNQEGTGQFLLTDEDNAGKQGGSTREAPGNTPGAQEGKGREGKGKDEEPPPEKEPARPATPSILPTPSRLEEIKKDVVDTIDARNLGRDGRPHFGNDSKKSWEKEYAGRRRLWDLFVITAGPKVDDIAWYAEQFIKTAHAMKQQQKFPMTDQPFTAALLSSEGIFPRINEEVMKAERVEDVSWVEGLEDPGGDDEDDD